MDHRPVFDVDSPWIYADETAAMRGLTSTRARHGARAHVGGLVLARAGAISAALLLGWGFLRLKVVRRRRARLGKGTQVLGVTVGHPDDVSADRYEPTRGVLSSVAALGADAEHVW